MKSLKHILIVCFIASFALGSCSKMEPLNKATVTEATESDVVVTKISRGDSGDDVDGSVITDPDHDEDHDKDKVTTNK